MGAPPVEIETPQADTEAFVTQDTILVVEDDEGIRKLMTTILQDQGYNILAAGDGIEALQKLQLCKGPCHLVIADVIIPRMKSTAFIEAVKTMRPEARVLYMSGYAGETLLANGVNDDLPFLQKPFLPTTLIEKVRELLHVPTPR